MKKQQPARFCVKKWGYYFLIVCLFHFVSLFVHYLYLHAFNRFYKTQFTMLHVKKDQVLSRNQTDQSCDNLIQEELLPVIGNESYPPVNEQFTVVILTYKRETILRKTLMNLNGLKSINKTIIVWNDITNNPPDFQDMKLTYPIEVVVPTKNSLNNRFFVYEQIQTEAILSLDDDITMDQGIIKYMFRVWQLGRYSIVGTVHRSHIWNDVTKSWKYVSSECYTSMILLGAAFYHKIFNYAYRTLMSKKILKIVDEVFNCEDFAMNFLVANLTKHPPVRVGNPINSFCWDCKSNLSAKTEHGKYRNICLNMFAKIYGHMPLKYALSSFPASQMKICPEGKLPNLISLR